MTAIHAVFVVLAALPPHVSHVDAETARCPTDEPCLYFEDSAYVMRKNDSKGSWIVDVGLPNLPILEGVKNNGELFDRATEAMAQLAKQLKAPTVKVHCSSVAWLNLPLPENAAGAILVDVPAGATKTKAPKPLSLKEVNELIAKRRQELELPPSPPFFNDADQRKMVQPGVGAAPYISIRAGRFSRGTGKYDLKLWLVYSDDHRDVFVLDRSGSGDAPWASDEETRKRDTADGPALVDWLRSTGVQRVAAAPKELCKVQALLGGEWLTWTTASRRAPSR
jgi:hypothetical protein